MRYTLCLLFLLAAVPTSAQVPVNPSRIEWNCPDHAVDTDHEVGFFLAGATSPVQAVRLGDPPAVSGTLVQADINARPVNVGQYELRLRVYQNTAVTAYAAGGPLGDQPVPFERALFRPDSLRVVR